MNRRTLTRWASAIAIVAAGYLVAPAQAQPRPAAATQATTPAQVCLGADFVMVLDRSGTLWAWGGSTGNGEGQMGLGNDRELESLAGRNADGGAWHLAAQKVGTGYRTVACNEKRSAAIRQDGTLWAWGRGYVGNGDPVSPSHYLPVKIGAGYAQVAVGEDYTLALKSDGSLWAWGENGHGQLGDGTTAASAKPVKVGSEFAQISAGRTHSAAIKTDGSLWMWGANKDGQLGLGEPGSGNVPAASLQPTRVMANVVSVAVGDTYTAAVKQTGELLAWGHSRHAFGRGIEEDRSGVPVPIGADFTRVVMDHSHALALKQNGEVWEWGWRTQGERNLVPALMLRNATFVATGGYASAALQRDGSLWLWGGENWQALVDRGGYAGYGEGGNDSNYLSAPTLVRFPLARARALAANAR